MNLDSKRDDALFQYASFLATSARGTLEEGVFVGSFRLIDAIIKLVGLFPQLRDDAFFAPLLAKLDAGFRRAYFMEEAEYKAFLDEVVVMFANEIRRREGL
jgi:hypothetical protein